MNLQSIETIHNFQNQQYCSSFHKVRFYGTSPQWLFWNFVVGTNQFFVGWLPSRQCSHVIESVLQYRVPILRRTVQFALSSCWPTTIESATKTEPFLLRRYFKSWLFCLFVQRYSRFSHANGTLLPEQTGILCLRLQVVGNLIGVDNFWLWGNQTLMKT